MNKKVVSVALCALLLCRGAAAGESPADRICVADPDQTLGIRGPNHDLDGAWQAAAKGRVNALVPIKNSRADEKVCTVKPAGPHEHCV